MQISLALSVSSPVVLGGSRIPSWVTPGALADGDFVNGRYWLDNRLVTVSEFVPCTRAGNGAHDFGDSTGLIGTYNANVLRLNDRGLLIEPNTENRWLYSNDPSNAAWTKNEVTVGSTSNGFKQILETTVSALHRLFRGSGIGLTTGQAYTFTATVKKRGRRYLFLRISIDGGATSKNVGFDLDTVAVTYANTGAGVAGAIEKVGDTYFLSATLTPTSANPTVSIATSNVSVTSDSVPAAYAGDTAQGFDFYGFDVVLGTVKRSPVDTAGSVLSRLADAYSTTFVGSGSHDVTFIFDDDSQQDISGVSAGAYAYPTNLSRPLVKRIVWGDV